MADDALALDLGADHEPGHVGQEHQRDVEGVAAPHEAGRLVGRVHEQDPALHLGVVGHEAHRAAVDQADAAHQLGSEQGLDLEEALGVDQAVDHGAHVVRGLVVVGHRRGGERVSRGCGLVVRRVVAPVDREVGEPGLGLLQGVLVVHRQVVAAARHRGVHAGAAGLLQRGLLPDHHLGHAGRPQVHGGVALHHDDDVAEARDVGAAGGRRAEQAADLGYPAREAHLVVEDAARAAPAREQLHLVGDAGAGRVDQPEDGHLVLEGVLGEPHDLLDGAGPPRPRLHGGVVGHHAHRAAVDGAHAGDHAVGGQVGSGGVGQQGVLHERPGVQQQVQPVADEELALLGQLVAPLGQVPGERTLRGGGHTVRGGRVGDGGHIGHGLLLFQAADAVWFGARWATDRFPRRMTVRKLSRSMVNSNWV